MKTENKPGYFFSPSTVSFYPELMLDDYRDAGTLPDDLVSVENEVFAEFSGTPPDGKIRGVIKGKPAWVDIPPLSTEELIQQAEETKQRLIAEVHTETAMLRAKLALGRIKDDEKALLNAWLDYLDELEAVDVSTASDIIWPVKPVV
ncbi:tail fiber assembly protein [Hafnia alvei]|uniref:tail fiber assembly protein n=1 Tax=Hafnia alvei TaxID=569 RepID=UPI0028BA78B6|nr:tail fiber assembly protein [Yersinia enterocolitica]ELI8440726.1 tail fiber assembly protein [Yersinia enterocolitica]